MSKEWSSPFNPFNSMKALVHADRFEAIVDCNPKAPVVVNMDLTNVCNYKCGFCMFGGQRERTDKQGESFRKGNAKLPNGYVLQLPKLWKEWGVKGVCLAGGGEPTLHPDCLEFMVECKTQGLDLGFVSNGYMVSKEYWKPINDSCKFVGFSVDAGTPEDYEKVKGVKAEQMQTVLDNMKGIRSQGNVQIGYKFVLDRDNYKHIFEAAQLAKENGATHFQFRPAIEPDVGFYDGKLDKIWGQIEKAQVELEDENFKVMGVRHKFNADLSKKHNFKKCLANLLTTTWCADGNVYMCTDSRGCDWSLLTNHYPNPQKVIDYWGSHEHIQKIKNIDFHKTCDRCTLAPYNEMIEQVFQEDRMDKNLI